MSSRIGFMLATVLLLLAGGLRLWNLTTLPPGLSATEIVDIRITESMRAGNVAVFYNLEPLGETGGREGIYHAVLAATTSVTGGGLIGYRMLSVLANMIMLALVYALTTRLYGPLAGVAALALLTLGMWPILLSRTIGRETLLPLLIAAALLAIARALPVYYQPPPHEPGTIPFTALGIVLGIGFYLHPANYLLALGIIIFIVYMVVSPHQLSTRTLSYIGFAVLVLIIMAMPYLLSTIRLPEISGITRVFGSYRLDTTPPLQSIINGLTGIFFAGDASPAHNLPGRPLIDLVSGLMMLIGLMVAVQRWHRPRFTLPLIIFIVLVPAAFLSTQSPDFTRFSVLLPLIALFFGLGVTTLYNSLRQQSQIVLGVALVALFGFNLVWTTRDLFTVWPQLPEAYTVYNGRIGQLAHHIDSTADDLPTVVCTPTVQAFLPRPILTDAQLLILMMNTSGRSIRYADCGTGLVLTDGGEQQQVILPRPNMREDIHPYLERWLDMGEVQQGPLLPDDSVIVMDIAGQLASRIGSFTTTAPVRYPPEATGEPEVIFPPVTFGGNLTFLGYEQVETESYKPGDVLTAIGYWRVDGPLPPDVRLFTHLTTDPNVIIAQNDVISVLARQLRARDVFIQITFVPLPASAPQGSYEVSIGAYQQSDGMRLPIMDDAQKRATRIFLAANGFTVTHE